MKYSETDMAALISEVEAEFSKHLAKSEKTDKETVEIKKSEETVIKTESTDKQVQNESEFDYDQEDITEMNKMYKSMKKAEAEAHYTSIKKALFNETEVKIAKSEEKIESKEQNEGESLLKSELTTIKEENQSLKKSNEEIKGNLDKLVAVLTKSVKNGSAPKQKAITKMEYIAKSDADKKDVKAEEVDVTKLSKSEISSRLTSKVREGSLKKSDKEAINKYYLEANTDLKSIKHLL